MGDRKQETPRTKLNEDLKPALDKEQVRDLDQPKEQSDKVRGGGATCARTR